MKKKVPVTGEKWFEQKQEKSSEEIEEDKSQDK